MSVDRVEHGFPFVENLSVPEPEDFVSLRLEPSVPMPIPRRFPVKSVLLAVNLDHQAPRMANEIRDVRADRNLTAELQAGEAMRLEGVPELAFRRGQFAPKLLCPTPLAFAHPTTGRLPLPPCGGGLGGGSLGVERGYFRTRRLVSANAMDQTGLAPTFPAPLSNSPPGGGSGLGSAFYIVHCPTPKPASAAARRLSAVSRTLS